MPGRYTGGPGTRFSLFCGPVATGNIEHPLANGNVNRSSAIVREGI